MSKRKESGGGLRPPGRCGYTSPTSGFAMQRLDSYVRK